MIFKSFIQASIAVIILASNLTISVNAAAISARQFLFSACESCTRRALLTSNLGFPNLDYDRCATWSVIRTRDNEKRFGKFLFLGLIDREDLR
jgi:hypothetical protein